MTAQAQSAADAVEILKLCMKNAESLPIKKRFIILNEYHGKFTSLEQELEFTELLDLAQSENVTVIGLERCQTEVWDQIEGKFMKFRDLAKLGYTGFMDRFNLDEFAASGAQHDLVQWLNKHDTSFRAAGLVLGEHVDHDALQFA